jgi:hypothetical protein
MGSSLRKQRLDPGFLRTVHIDPIEYLVPPHHRFLASRSHTPFFNFKLQFYIHKKIRSLKWDQGFAEAIIDSRRLYKDLLNNIYNDDVKDFKLNINYLYEFSQREKDILFKTIVEFRSHNLMYEWINMYPDDLHTKIEERYTYFSYIVIFMGPSINYIDYLIEKVGANIEDFIHQGSNLWIVLYTCHHIDDIYCICQICDKYDKFGINTRDRDGKTILWYALVNNEEHKDIVMLIDRGATYMWMPNYVKGRYKVVELCIYLRRYGLIQDHVKLLLHDFLMI